MSLEGLFKARQANGLLVPLLNEHLVMEGKKPSGRSTGVFHPSEVSGFFCPRQWVIQERYRSELPIREIGPGLMRTFAIGHKLHDMMQDFLSKMGILYGNFQCKRCEEVYLGLKPEECLSCGKTSFRYLEVKVQDTHLHIDGHTDGVVILGDLDSPFRHPKKYIFEFKTINSTGFQNLRKPIDAHREQGSIYLTVLDTHRKNRLKELEESGVGTDTDVWKVESLPFEGVIIVYLNKGQQDAEGVRDLKEFLLTAEEAEALMEPKYPLLEEAWHHFTSEEQTLPDRVCDNRTAGHKCRCPKPIIDRCFGINKDD